MTRPSPSSRLLTRRAMLQRVAASAAATLAWLRAPPRAALPAGATIARVEHPDPRPGITSEKVLSDEEIPERSRAAYRAAREIPGVLDGLYCHCDCGRRDGLRSLLSCFETRMPASCGVCREEAVMALRLHRQGRSLDEIRAAVDKKYTA